MAQDGKTDPVRTLDPETLQSLHNVDQDLRLALPDFMIPSYYLPVHKFPLTSSGKADTRQLQEWILRLDKEEQLAQYSLATRAEFQLPATDMEVRLQKLWADILDIEAYSIGRDDSFLRLGGDSISAIRLVASARGEGIRITVSSIFRDPRLSQVAASAVLQDTEDDETVAPWSLIPVHLRELTATTAREICELSASDEIEDMYPATVLQEGLMSLAVKKPGSYIARMAYELPSEVDEERFKRAWEETLRICAILRTRIVTQGARTIQVIIRQAIKWDNGELDNVKMEHGTRLCRYSLVEGPKGKLFNLVIHHAVFDGWSLPLIMGRLLHAYENGTAPSLTPYSGFVKYALGMDMPKAAAYWQSQLKNATRPSFPRRPDTTSGPKPATSQSLARHVPFDTTEELPVTKATVLRAAWAILLAKYNDDTQDITFSATVAGRQAPVAGIDHMAGPVIATVPVRIKLSDQQSVAQFLQDVQTQGAEMMPYEQMGLQNIAKLGQDARNACDSSSLLVIQPYKILKDTTNSLLQLRSSHAEDDAASSALAGYFTYPLVWQCYVTDTETALHITFDSSVLTLEQVETMIEQFCHIIQQLITPDAYTQEDLTLSQVSVSGSYDMALVRDWNNKVTTEIISSTFPSLVEEQARIRPDAPAIFAWDRSFSYRELDAHANRLASLILRKYGVVLEELVLVCFEKSAWFYIAILAINKLGAAWVPLDPSHPRNRHEKVASQSRARLALVSSQQEDKCQGLVEQSMTISSGLDLWTENQDEHLKLPTAKIKPHNAAYVLFTSGTTGTPKGIVMEHGSLCTSQTAISQRLGLQAEHVRLLQFAAYVFDLSIGEMIAPLISGGCLCVPSEEERMNDLAGFINRARVNWAFLTPSFARLIVPETIPTLELLLLAGEPVGKDLLATWIGRGVRLINGWGPSETCCFSSLHEWSSPDESPLNIGYPVGGRCWIVSPEDHHQLAPIGCIGEVVIQGPTLAREYLAFPEGTRDSFVIDLPAWAPQLDSHYTRFYKSGDLAYYNPDGTLEFVARKDTQVKVRGFRIELSEIEHYIRAGLEGVRQVAVDVIAGSEDNGSHEAAGKLVAYLCFSQATSSPDAATEGGAQEMVLPLDAALSRRLAELKGYLGVRLPEYMVPAVFIPVGYMPFITSQKTDRNMLCAATLKLSAEALALYMLGNTEKDAPRGRQEVAMQKLWSEVLCIPVELVGRHDLFFQLGGDSLLAIRLVTKAREQGIRLTVGSLFKDPRLSQVTKAADYDFVPQDLAQGLPVPWALIPESRRPSIEETVREQCALSSADTIEDVYPATALQEGLIALAMKQPGSYMARFAFELNSEVDVDRFKEAWEETLQKCHALRTRIVLCSDQTVQAVIKHKHKPIWSKDSTAPLKMGYNTSLCSYSLTKSGSKRLFCITLHHAVFDGWSFAIIMRTLTQLYEGQVDSVALPAPYVGFVKYALALDQQQAAEYWRGQLAEASRPGFPRVSASTPSIPAAADPVSTSHVSTHQVPFSVEGRRLVVTKATILRAAWAIVMARYNDTEDITFGSAVAGRQAPVAGIENIVGPVLSTVPVRVRVPAQQCVNNYLLAIQAQAAGMIPFEHMGLQNISRLGPEARDACDFSSMFSVLHSGMISDAQTSLLIPSAEEGINTATDFGTYFTYPLVAQCFLSEQGATLELVYNSSALSPGQVDGIAAQYSHVVQQLLATQFTDEEGPILGDITLCGDWDVAQIKQWQDARPPIEIVDGCIHDLISAKAAQSPEKEAILSWDGHMSYAQLEQWTTKLGWHLGSLGVTRGSLVPICFEKSLWAVVAMLGIMKAGGAYVPLNPDSPLARQKRLVDCLGAPLVLVSPTTAAPFVELGIPTVTVNSSLVSSLRSGNPYKDDVGARVTSNDVAYVLFTSGSTGEPKGVVVEHRSLCSTVARRGDHVTFTEDSRVLQFSNYVFDISVCEIFATFLFGGTLCIPSEEERVNNLAGFINKAQVTCAMLTPTIARLISPAEVPGLKTLMLAGEAPSLENVKTWASRVELCNDYGPAEACIYVTTHRLQPKAPSASTIGRGGSAYLWIVDPNNHDRLAPVGCVGELLIEGPGVARGYLNDATKTEQSFLYSTSWLPRDGKRHKIYKTGDMVRYNQDGTIEYVGRKDSQVKLRGQRLEPGEIEYHIKQHVGLRSTSSVQIVELTTGSVLLAFISMAGQTAVDESGGISTMDTDTRKIVRSLNEGLQSILPTYMIPSYFLLVGHLPLTPSGKINSRTLRHWALALSSEQLAGYSPVQQAEFQPPQTPMEFALQKLLGEVLHLPADKIGRSDSFLQLGGDSIVAIRLVAAAREQNITLTVSSIFRDPRLKLIARAAIISHGEDAEEADAEPWSLLQPNQREDIAMMVRQQCSLSVNDVIEDVYPATPLQEGLMALATKNPGSYTARFVFELNQSVDVDRFTVAWNYTLRTCNILRTRLVLCGDQTVQAVLQEGLETQLGNDNMGYGRPLSQHSIIRRGDKTLFTLVMHHAIFDAWSIGLVFGLLTQAYHDPQSVLPLTPYSNFVRYTLGLDLTHAADYWGKQLAGAARTAFPPRPTPTEGETSASAEPAHSTSHMLRRRIPLVVNGQLPVTTATVLRAAWAIILAHYNDNADNVVFGAAVSGRQAPLAGIETIVGPVISTVPVRVFLPRKQSVVDLLLAVQTQANDMVSFEHMGIQNIAKLSADAREASDFSSLFSIQHRTAVSTGQTQLLVPASEADVLTDERTDLTTYFTYPLVGQCSMMEQEVTLELVYNTSVLTQTQVTRLAAQYDHVVQQLLSIQCIDGPQRDLKLEDITLCSDEDMQQINQWHGSEQELMTHNGCLHELITRSAAKSPDKEAIFSWDGSCTYAELESLTSTLGKFLRDQGVGKGSYVPICFKKSMWAIVAMIATLKAGGAFVPLNSDHPLQRRQRLVKGLKAPLILVSPETADECEGLGVPLVVVTASAISSFAQRILDQDQDQDQPHATPADAAYVIFTSGSTGEPKGVVVEHRAITSSIIGHGTAMSLGAGSRMLQFAPYIFDGAILECLGILMFQGCVCVPSEEDRFGHLAGFIGSARVNIALLTPSFARTLHSDELPTLKTLMLGGEALTREDIHQWFGRVRLLNVYGPTETSVIISVHPIQSLQTSSKNIGRGCNTRLWIADVHNHDRLTPIGCIGELLIQGPSLARGYLQDPKRTDDVFITSPSWLPSSPYQRLYKTGDLVMYHDDGTIKYVGRKDSQTKLRGQRLELGEIEYHIRESLGPSPLSSAQIIHRTSTGVGALFAFVCKTGETGKATESNNNAILKLDDDSLQMLRSLDESLRLVLPAYMVPTYYLPISKLPLSLWGKTDSRALQEWALSLSPEDLKDYSLTAGAAFEPPTTPMQMALQKLWGEVLGVDFEKIGCKDSFLQLGGDSITAIRLVAAARDQQISLTVASIFRDPRLSQVAASAKSQDKQQDDAAAEPYSLIAQDEREPLIEDVRKQCALSTEAIVEDIYPTTALQEGLIALTVKQRGSYIARFTFELADGVGIDRFKAAWEETVEACPALRTRILLCGDRTVQAIIQQKTEWADGSDLVTLPRMEYATPLCSYSIRRYRGTWLFSLVLHHAIFDGWSVGLIFQRLSQAYKGTTSPPNLVPYAGFVRYALELDQRKAAEYWRGQLEGASQPVFPRKASVPLSSLNGGSASTSQTLRHLVPFDMPTGVPITKATVLRAAWAIVLARYNNGTNDITFGAAVAGRQAPVTGIENMVGPVISTLPVRVKINPQQGVSSFLHQIQSQATDMMPYEHMGLQHIAKLAPDAREACDFSSLLVIQPQAIADHVDNSFLKHYNADTGTPTPGDGDGEDGNDKITDQKDPVDSYFSYPLVWQCYLAGTEVYLHVTFESSVLSEQQVRIMAEQFCHVIKGLLAPEAHLDASTSSLSDVTLCGPHDTAIMTKWTKEYEAEEVISSTLHALVERQAKIRPSASAIHAWDGQLSYRELDDMATRWASFISHEFEIKPNEMVILCFEKSMWFYIAMLAVNKAGGAWVPLDPSHPSHRHKQITQQVGARILLTSPTVSKICRDLVEHVVVLSADADEKLTHILLEKNVKAPARSVQPNHIAYVLFTSGTTGIPKGMIMEHGALCTSMSASSKRLRVKPEKVRLLQFAAYVFDLAIGEIIMPLISGASICVPSDHQRLNDLPRFVAQSRANWFFLTPSTARILSPADFPSLEFLLLGGEAVGKDHLVKWIGHCRLVNAWGPSEACCFASFREYQTVHDSPLNIGFPVGARSWIVEPDDYRRLAPIGCVGEVVLQGPTLAREYLAFEAGTKESFISELPDWAPDREHPQYSRIYKSGDLAYFNPDGTMEFVSRKDTQVKVRGFRIELGEVESQIREALGSAKQVVVDVLNTKGSHAVSRLVAYLCFSSNTRSPENGSTDSADMVLPMDESFAQQASALKSLLQVKLPSYMVPVIYIPVRYMPFITSQKTDRSLLRSAAGAVSDADMACYMLANAQHEAPVTPMEIQMQGMWADILSIPLEQIGRNGNFLHLGGDSLSAMRLITRARQHGLDLSVASIFRDPRLSQVALSTKQGPAEDQDGTTTIIPAWSLVPEYERATIEEAAEQQCKLSHEQTIEDVYPTTALQEGLMALAVQQPGSYTAKFSFELRDSDANAVDRFKAAWEDTLQVCAALRTRIFRYGSRTMQAVIQSPANWQSSATEASRMEYGSALCQYAIFRRGDRTIFSLTMHHAIFDGWSLSVVMRTLAQVYEGSSEVPTALPPYSRFVKYIGGLDKTRGAQYWREQLKDATSLVFPSRPVSKSEASSNGMVSCRVSLKDASKLPVTKATILRAAWAVVLSKYNSNVQDVTFGAAVAGRQAQVSDIERIVGPVIATVPIRVKLDPDQSVTLFIEAIQAQAAEMMPFEQTGIQNIAQLGTDASEACNFASLFAVQHQAIFSGTETSFLVQPTNDIDEPGAMDYNTYFTYPLVGQCYLLADEASLELIYDTSALTKGQATALAAQYNHVVQQLLASQGTDGKNRDNQLRHISMHGDWDFQQISKWRESEPNLKTVTSTIHQLVSRRTASIPDREAIYAWDGHCTYAELEGMTNSVAGYLQAKGVVKGSLIPICFEKSMWTIVAMLAVMKAGGAFVPLSPDDPLSRRQQLVAALKAPLMLVSPATLGVCQDIQVSLVVLPTALVSSPTLIPSHGLNRPEGTSDETQPEAAYVLFTSGSTGEPKGVVVDHYAIASSLFGHGNAMGISSESRVLQFSNYIFDACITECLGTLVSGGCVCVPSNEQRLGALGEFMNNARVTWALFTPSFARTLDPKQLRSLQTLVLGGEAPSRDVVDMWLPHVNLVNAYGPAEAAVCIATHNVQHTEASPRTIGRGCNAHLWIVDLDSDDRLAAVGCLGELVVQGPGLARGYLNDDVRSANAFIESPLWLPLGPYKRVYRTGDLVRYNDNGTIEYVGRRDAQVKLRGQRLEPGEIEHHIMELLPIARQVAVTKVQIATQEILVAFIRIPCHQAESLTTFDLVAMDDSLLQAFVVLSEDLARRLTSYMVPAYFVPVTAMPVTPTGKLDTKLLQKTLMDMTIDEVRQYAAFQKAPFQAPRNDTESELRRIFANTLGIEETRISIDDNFYHLGGDSLKVVTLQSHIRSQFDKTLDVQFINSRGISVRTLAPFVLGEIPAEGDGSAPGLEKDLGSVFETLLKQVWPKSLDGGRHDYVTGAALPLGAHVLLTGGTGYLGSALLRHLLVEPSIGKVAVLVRARDGTQALERVKTSAQIAGWWDERYLAKIDVWQGDLGMRGFGLARNRWMALNGNLDAGNIDAIVHNGAAVDWSLDFAALKPVNVDSTLQLIDVAFASPAHPKIVYISGGPQIDPDEDRVTVARSLSSHNLGYSQTKVLSELIIGECAARLPAHQHLLSTVKPGRIIGTSENGIANTDDLIWRIVAAAARIQAWPQEPVEHRMRVADTDLIAGRVLQQLSLPVGETATSTFTSYTTIDSDISIVDFWRVVGQVLSDAGAPLAPVSWEEWLLKVSGDIESEGEHHVLWPIQQFLGRLGSPMATQNAKGISQRVEAAVHKNVEYLLTSGYIVLPGKERQRKTEDIFARNRGNRK